jgi:CO/xanthine dehydrogenase FAD-binding subunit
MTIQEYRKVRSLDEAYSLLQQSPANQIVAGCTFLRRGSRKINVAVDLSDCGLSYITQDESGVHIGAYTSLRAIETSPVVASAAGDVFREVLRHLIGVQLRNQITVGAHVYSLFGFSDIIPTLLCLNAQVTLHHAGSMPLRDFLTAGVRRDLMTEILLPPEGRRARTQMMRNAFGDYSIFCRSVSRSPENGWIVAAGARPGRAMLAEKAMAELDAADPGRLDIDSAARRISEEFTYGSNFRGSAEYRKQLCRVFASRALRELSV